ncbi:hydrolase [Jejuia pallidilutea]|uniref:Hydrolase n=1 Tax=Jejuia pallidilutea TaxID=504487 RepID=A0A090VRR2_9FLAO|nr:hydrolase [Jejuia pallidilutea]
MEIKYNNIKVIGFDADDTLWVNETYFREAEQEFAKLLSEFETPNKIDQELFKKEIGTCLYMVMALRLLLYLW